MIAELGQRVRALGDMSGKRNISSLPVAVIKYLVAHTFNASNQEVSAGTFLWVQGNPGLHSKFRDSQSYIDSVSKQSKIGSLLVN